LKERAYKAAWANNFLTLAFFNATDRDMSNIRRLNVTPGMAFHSSDSASNNSSTASSSTFSIEYQAIRSSLYFGDYLSFPDTSSSGNASASNSSSNAFNGVSEFDFIAVCKRRPLHHLLQSKYHLTPDKAEICAGSKSSSPANINSSIVGCGLVYGAARRTDGGSELSPQPGSQWSVPVYSCAASVRAQLRTVTFLYNGTGTAAGTSPSLSALTVTTSIPKPYPSPLDIPLWAVENITPTTPLASVQPLWGLLGPAANATIPPALTANLTTSHQPILRLPGTVTATSPLTNSPDYIPDKIGQNLPGVDFYAQALQNVFAISRPGSVGYEGYADYSGLTSLALYKKWMDLSATADGTAQIVNLVWTDIAANAVVGTRGWSSLGGGGGSDDGQAQVLVSVTPYARRVRYRLAYAAPAIVVLVLAAGVVAAALVLLALGRTGAGKVRRLLDATSAGRLMGRVLWPAKAGAVASAKTKEWVQVVGMKVVKVGAETEGCDGGGGEAEKRGTKKASTTVVRAVPDEEEMGAQERLMEGDQMRSTDES
jgi:hypothetical protein